MQRQPILVLTLICVGAILTVADTQNEIGQTRNGPLGSVKFKKNDSDDDWIRVPEENYKTYVNELKKWRIWSIVLGIFCLIFAALVLTYVIHSFRTNSAGPFGCMGESKSDEKLALAQVHLPIHLQQLALQHQLELAQQEQDAQRQKLEAERTLSAIRNNPMAILRNTITIDPRHGGSSPIIGTPSSTMKKSLN